MKTLFCLFILFSGIELTAQTTLEGKVTDGATGEVLLVANVVVHKEGVFRYGTATDFDGYYKITLDPGTYDVSVSYVGYPEQKIEGVIVEPGKANKLDVQMQEGIILEPFYGCCFCWFPPLIEFDNTTSGNTEIAEEIEVFPSRNIEDIILNTAGVSISRN